MTINLLQTPEYTTLMKSHILKTVEYLFSKNQEFSLACEIQHTHFTPELPHEIQETFDDIVLFILHGYTFETATIDEEYLSFEAGFGENNFGSRVSVPLLGIKQILLGEHPIILNLAKYEKNEDKNIKREVTSSTLSMEALLNNPENKKLLKKRK
jgi:hypothetical protein